MTGGLAVPPPHPRRLVFAGTPETAVPSLRALADAGYDIAVVVTGPDARRGRREAPSPSPVKVAALELGLPVGHDIADGPATGADLGVVVAYGRLIRRPVLERLAFVNVHFSLLPRWRGAAPVERAILAGDERTGVCVMGLEETLDTGPVYACRERAIQPRATAGQLAAALAEDGADLLVATLAAGLTDPVPQAGEPTWADKLTSDDRRLDWTRPAVELARVVRVGGAWTTLRARRLIVVDAELEAGDGSESPLPPGAVDGVRVGTGDGHLRLGVVRPEGRAAVAAADWANGARLTPGERLA